MFLDQSVYYQANTAFISASMQVANRILGVYNTNFVHIVLSTNVIGDIALNTPGLGVSNSFCNDPVVKIISDGLTSIVGVLTALGVAVAVVGIVIGGLMRATAWGSEQRIAMSNKAISSAVLGLIIVLLGVILGTAVPKWFGLQNSTCPLGLPSSAPSSGPSSFTGPSSSSMASLSSMLAPSSLARTVQQPLSSASSLSGLTAASVSQLPPNMLDYTYQEFSYYTNLTTEGTLDWKQWGLNQVNDVNHKSGVDSMISNITLIGAGQLRSDLSNPISFTWSDGAPFHSAFGGTGALAMTGLGHGFSITVPASSTPRTLRLYVGAHLAKGLLTASLNGMIRQDATLDMQHNPLHSDDNAVYTIYYRTNSPNQELTINYTLSENDSNQGYILLEAATLQ